MNAITNETIAKEGALIVYNDGRAGHTDVFATVLVVKTDGMIVQFDDRAESTSIRFSDRGWMDFIRVTT